MATLSDASLTDVERRVLERFVRLLAAELGPDLPRAALREEAESVTAAGERFVAPVERMLRE